MALWPQVRELPPRQRAVIVLRYYEQLSEAEIADALGCSRGNVKSTAHRALQNLRTALDGREPVMHDELERTLARELDDVASTWSSPRCRRSLRVRPVPAGARPRPSSGQRRWWSSCSPRSSPADGGDSRAQGPGRRPARPPHGRSHGRSGSLSRAMPRPGGRRLDLYVGGEQVPGRWWLAEGRGTHWIAPA